MNLWRFLFGRRFASGGVVRGNRRRVGEVQDDEIAAILAHGGEVVLPKGARPSSIFTNSETVTVNIQVKGGDR